MLKCGDRWRNECTPTGVLSSGAKTVCKLRVSANDPSKTRRRTHMCLAHVIHPTYIGKALTTQSLLFEVTNSRVYLSGSGSRFVRTFKVPKRSAWYGILGRRAWHRFAAWSSCKSFDWVSVVVFLIGVAISAQVLISTKILIQVSSYARVKPLRNWPNAMQPKKRAQWRGSSRLLVSLAQFLWFGWDFICSSLPKLVMFSSFRQIYISPGLS